MGLRLVIRAGFTYSRGPSSCYFFCEVVQPYVVDSAGHA